jgi:WD40 repeat protein
MPNLGPGATLRRAGRLFGLLGCLGLWVPGAALAQWLPEEPLLTLETGMHVSRVDRIDLDAASRLMITGSHDKTARLWDAETGEPLQVLRLPLGPGNEGQVRAVALSPDGATAAVGGWTLYGRSGDNSLFFFDTASGRMTGRLDGFGDVILDLEYSPDGRYLAVATAGPADRAVVDAASRQVVRWLDGYAGTSYNLAWAPDGRLATVSYDGWLRIYDSDFRLAEAVQPDAGPLLFGLAFSPDGTRLAVGATSSNRIQVFDAYTLEFLYEPANDRIGENSDIAKPAWSPDGATLYAGSSHGAWFEEHWYYLVRAWAGGGRGTFHDFGFAADNVLDIKIAPNGDIIAASGRPDLTRLGIDGSFVWWQDPPTPDYSAIDRTHLRVSADGAVIGATPLDAPPFSFDLPAREVREIEAAFPPPREAAGNLAFSDWLMSREPLLNGASVGLDEEFETSTAVSVAADGSFAVLASEWNLYRYDADGSRRYIVPVPTVAWTVNIAEGGRLFVVAHGDGTLRWYRAEDGKELLAFFLHNDRTRWVAWTPSGYYDAAPGGEELIGWHVNRGLDAEPAYFPASLFRDSFYRPDILREVLHTLDEAEAVAVANARRQQTVQDASIAGALPPVVRITSPVRGERVPRGSLTLEMSVTAPEAAPLTELQLRVNGRLQRDAVLQPPHGDAADGELRHVTLDLTEVQGEEAIITAQGVNRHGFGPPVDLNLEMESRRFEAFTAQPKLYVLSVGVSDYLDPALRLSYAAKDAEDMAAFLVKQRGRLYGEVVVRLITDENATIDAIRDGLFWLEDEVTANDTATIFIAGHGVNDARGELHFLPYEADLDALRRTALPAADIVRTVQYLQGRVLYFMDTCHSGNLDVVRRGAVTLDLNRHIQDLSAVETGAVVFSSAAGSQYALESPEWGNGAFTLAVLEGLRGAADFNADGSVSLNELNLFVSDMVKQLTNNQQTPVLQKPSAIRDFPLALLE